MTSAKTNTKSAGEYGRNSADRKAKSISSRQAVPRRKPADMSRRRKYEADAQAWLKYYMAESFRRPFERPHVAIIDGVMNADANSGRFCVAAERGIGKSSLLWGLILMLQLSGRQRFPVCVPWDAAALKRAFKFWKNALCHNQRLARDYPEFCDPFVLAKGIAQRVATTTWADTGEPTGARLAVGDGIIALPSGLGCLGGATINGNIRGLNHATEIGEVLRPTIVLIDDVQDRKTAKSASQVADTIATIDGDVGGCGDVGKDLPMLMACNCICKDDVSAHYLASDEWVSVRIPRIDAWPTGWDDPKSRSRELWAEWSHLRHDDDAAIAFYSAHITEMTDGMTLSAPSSVKPTKTTPDAVYATMRMYYQMGHEAFMAERQQDPVDPVKEAGPYTITPDLIQSRATARKPYERPDWVTTIIASTDINPSYALSTTLIGYGPDQSACVLWYGLHKLAIDSTCSSNEAATKLYAELLAHGQALAAAPVRPDYWAIDAGGAQFDAVCRFIAESTRTCGLNAMGYQGRAGKNYRPYGRTLLGQPREQCHQCVDRKAGRQIKWVAWHSDYWREVAQRAWLSDVGAPGGLSLHAGRHSELAGQICAERLLGKADIGGDMIWNWHVAPGRHDFGDCLAQSYAAAAMMGIGTGSGISRSAAKKRRVLVGKPSNRRMT